MSTVVLDRVVVECSDVASVDGIDDGSVEGCVVETAEPAHKGNYWLNLEDI